MAVLGKMLSIVWDDEHIESEPDSLGERATASVLIDPTMMPIPRTAVSIKPVSQQLPLIVLLPTLAWRVDVAGRS